MIAPAVTASWCVPFLVVAVAAAGLGYPGAASFAAAAALWALAASGVAAVGSFVLSAVGQRSVGDGPEADLASRPDGPVLR